MSQEPQTLDAAPEGLEALLPSVVDHVALARLYGEPLFTMPRDLYIPPDALQIFLEAFEGPLDLLLYLIRKQNFNILDIPMAAVTRQYLSYVDEIRRRQPGTGGRIPADGGHADRDQVAHAAAAQERPPKAKSRRPACRTGAPAARIRTDEAGRRSAWRDTPQYGRDFLRAQVHIEQSLVPRFPDVHVLDLQSAWRDILKRAKLVQHHRISRENCRCANT
jgi:segregation and condensation protein A